ncbi:hypothetical protein J3R82DRAFT_3251 [Butyriboletus roseoflavus]|nr:hypothetical protein J3R82DRAFT_3251 [Butyriboletus roseoflavus]
MDEGCACHSLIQPDQSITAIVRFYSLLWVLPNPCRPSDEPACSPRKPIHPEVHHQPPTTDPSALLHPPPLPTPPLSLPFHLLAPDPDPPLPPVASDVDDTIPSRPSPPPHHPHSNHSSPPTRSQIRYPTPTQSPLLRSAGERQRVHRRYSLRTLSPRSVPSLPQGRERRGNGSGARNDYGTTLGAALEPTVVPEAVYVVRGLPRSA